MGVPKFFRWMSERYPAISQLIAENRIPEFDCLYLDMNGIIHNCTHKDSDSVSFRMTEDKMFIAIFNYIEHLFSKIKPQKLFFMAVDGVAPRAKMNQQRSRRFRTALDTEKARNKAIKDGVELPKEEPFDSNSITPGTDFMARLTKQLKYFINKKVSEDVVWQGCEVILSGHEVPGEGEHKIMEYIRHAKAQKDYDPNMRHCLYGLDADLIMLGLLSHDPHFCLLREEVTFGRQASKKSKELEHQNFFLMHLCIVREYLELEFQDLKEPDAIPFEFDLERVIDDFILMAFFVGNDFLPNLPNLHINEGALALMFKIYRDVLPRAGGYINELGVINLERLALLLDELSHVEFRFFEAENQDAAWFRGKQMEREDVMVRGKGKRRGQNDEIVITTPQQALYKQIRTFVNTRPASGTEDPFNFSSKLPAKDRKFVQDLADELHLQWKTAENETGERYLSLQFPAKLAVDEDDESEEDEESQLAIQRIFKRYDNARVEDMSAEEAKLKANELYEKRFQQWKDKYYQSKFEWDTNNSEELRKLTENYVEGLQWVLYYYYQGVASWPWFYGYHYAPMISDVRKGLSANLDFKLGQPFKPFEQLMGVLPDRSKKIVPTAFHELMTSPESSIIDFYPRDFELDMNGKKMEWEAVVKIPFIEEDRLLKAMATKADELTDDEKARNTFGVTMKFTFSPDLDFIYPSSLAGIFPDLPHCRCVENIYDLPTMDGLEIYVGLMDGTKLGVSALAGFPSLQTIPHHATLDFHSVCVFQQDSRNESMVVTVLDVEARSNVGYAQKQLGQRAFVNYPFLNEGKVVRVSDELFDYVPGPESNSPPVAVPHGPHEIEAWKRKALRIQQNYSKRLGIVIGEVESMVHIHILKGLRKADDGSTVKEYAEVPGIETDYATQMIVDEVESEDQRFIEKDALPIEEEFPVGTRAFCLGDFGYGRPLEVTNHSGQKAEVWISVPKQRESDFAATIIQKAERMNPYTPSYNVASSLGLNPLVLSKITASFQVDLFGMKVNLGLNLKFEAKKLKVLGYSRRGDGGWEFSPRAIQLIQQYMVKFPEFIAVIQRKPRGDVYAATDFYAEDEALSKIKEIQAWLKSIESKSFEKVPLDAEQLDSEVVAMIEQASDAAAQNSADVEFKKLKNLPRNALLLPADAEHRLGNQSFTIGHRVVYVQDSGKVPIASRGTVVGMTRTSRNTLLDVVFDGTFMSGTTLNDRCSPFRGQTVPSDSVLNLTRRQLLVGSRANAERQKQQGGMPAAMRGYGMPSGYGNQGQLVPAGAPPPLRGSFGGAVSGSNRGRGGMAPNGGLNGVTQSLPIHTQAVNGARGRGTYSGASRGARGGNAATTAPNGNGNATGKSYNNMPPPADIDGQSRGRGRGRGGRSRGESNRGRGTDRGRGRGTIAQ